MPTDDHYSDHQWNELHPVCGYLQRRSTGDEARWWMDYLRDRYAPGGFEYALVLGCGNGWVERGLYDRGVAKRFDAFDVLPSYVEQAERERGERPIRYFVADFRSLRLDRSYDLIVNVAALHHARYLYRATKALTDALTPDGLFVHWEYVGPSRNQYPRTQYDAMVAVRDALPPAYRTPHGLRPDLRHAVAGDPTEAVHSAELPRAIHDYLDVVEWHDLGGGIAYQLLWNHVEPFKADTDEARAALATVLDLDERLSGTSGIPHLFAFVIARRKRGAPPVGALARRLVLEPVREAVARRTGDFYPVELARLAVANHPGLRPAARAARRLVGRPAGRVPAADVAALISRPPAPGRD